MPKNKKMEPNSVYLLNRGEKPSIVVRIVLTSDVGPVVVADADSQQYSVSAKDLTMLLSAKEAFAFLLRTLAQDFHPAKK